MLETKQWLLHKVYQRGSLSVQFSPVFFFSLSLSLQLKGRGDNFLYSPIRR